MMKSMWQSRQTRHIRIHFPVSGTLLCREQWAVFLSFLHSGLSVPTTLDQMSLGTHFSIYFLAFPCSDHHLEMSTPSVPLINTGLILIEYILFYWTITFSRPNSVPLSDPYVTTLAANLSLTRNILFHMRFLFFFFFLRSYIRKTAFHQSTCSP